MRCPKCKSINVKPIRWGMATYEAYKNGKYYIGGCCKVEDIEKILITTEPVYSNIFTREVRYCRFYSDGCILAYSTIGRSRKRQQKRRGKMFINQFEKIAQYLLEIIVYIEYDSEVLDDSWLTVWIQFRDKNIAEYLYSLQGIAVWDHI